MFTFSLHTEFHMPGSSSSLVVIIKWKAKCRFCITDIACVLKIYHHMTFKDPSFTSTSEI